MDRLKREIQSAFSNVAELCNAYFKNHPGYTPARLPYQDPRVMYGPPHQYPPYDPWNQRMMDPYGYSHQPYAYPPMQQDPHHQISERQSRIHTKPIVERKQTKPAVKTRSLQAEQSKKQKMKLKGTLKQRLKNDPRLAQMPKFPMTGYFLFLCEIKEKKILQIKSSKQFSVQVGRLWRQLSQSRKKIYLDKALIGKSAYDREVCQFYKKYPDLKPNKYQPPSQKDYSASEKNSPQKNSQSKSDQLVILDSEQADQQKYQHQKDTKEDQSPILSESQDKLQNLQEQDYQQSNNNIESDQKQQKSKHQQVQISQNSQEQQSHIQEVQYDNIHFNNSHTKTNQNNENGETEQSNNNEIIPEDHLELSNSQQNKLWKQYSQKQLNNKQADTSEVQEQKQKVLLNPSPQESNKNNCVQLQDDS